MENKFTEVPIEQYEEKTGLYLAQGKQVKDIRKRIEYAITAFDEQGLTLQEITFFKKEQPLILEITYEELMEGFSRKILAIEGFTIEQQKDLESCVSTLKKKIQLIIKQATFEQITKELENIKEEGVVRNKKDQEEINKLLEEKRALEITLKYLKN